MSGFLAGKVWRSALEPHLKPLAAALADIANDDGSSIFPTIAYVSWLLGAGESTVHRGMKALLDMGVLELVKKGGGIDATSGWGRPNQYRLVEPLLPGRPPWKGPKSGPSKKRRGADVRVSPETVKGVTEVVEGSHLEPQRVSSGVPNPSVEHPSVDPSVDPPLAAGAILGPPKETTYGPLDENLALKKKRAGPAGGDTDINAVLAWFQRAHHERFGGEPTIDRNRDARIAKYLLTLQPLPVIVEMIEDFMRLPADEFLDRTGRGMPFFQVRFNALLVARHRRLNGSGPAPDPRMDAIARAAAESTAQIHRHFSKEKA